MLDPKLLRADPQKIATQLARRGFVLNLAQYEQLETRRKQLQTETEGLQAERNAGSKRIGLAKSKGEDASPVLADMDRIKQQLEANTAALDTLQAEFNQFLLGLPNLADATAPDGRDEHANVEIRKHGEPTKLAFAAKDHADLGEALGQMDFAVAAKLTGSRFVVLRTRLVADSHRRSAGDQPAAG